MTEVTLTCKKCGSGIYLTPDKDLDHVNCRICEEPHKVLFDQNLLSNQLVQCPCCQRKDFYKQKDFNRKIGVLLFVVAAILSIFTYGISLVVLYILDLILYQKLPEVVSCYKCNTLFRKIENLDSISVFNHEMNDRILYDDQDFDGKQLNH